MSKNDPTYYEILQVPRGAGHEAIEAAYERMAEETRPMVGARPVAAARMADLDAARSILGNPITRAEYDAQLGPEKDGGMIGFFSSATPSRKILFGIGAMTLVAGIGLLVFGGISALSGGDDGPTVAVIDVTPTPAPTAPLVTEGPTPVPTPVGEPPLPDAGYVMKIDKIGVNGPVDVYGLDEEAVPIVPEGDNAAEVIAWYDFSARPGTGSNAVFAGHVTWFGPGVFYSLTSVAVGDEIKLEGTDGTALTYKISEVFQVLASDPDAVNVMKGTTSDVLTIITCDGTFTADPNDDTAGGSYDNRLVVRATLESRTPGNAVSAGG